MHHLRKSVFWSEKKSFFKESPQAPVQVSNNIALTEVTQPILTIAVTHMFGGLQHRSLKQAILYILCINQTPLHRNSCAQSSLRLSVFFLRHSCGRASCFHWQKFNLCKVFGSPSQHPLGSGFSSGLLILLKLDSVCPDHTVSTTSQTFRWEIEGYIHTCCGVW